VKINGFYRGDISFRALAKPLRMENRGSELRVDKLEGSIRMDRGDFEADNVHSPVMLRTGSTDVKMTNFSGPLEIEVTRGDIRLNPGTNALSAWKVRTGAGDLEVALVGGFELAARTGRGEIETDYSELRTESSHGNAEVHGAVGGGKGKGPSIDLATGRGHVRISKGGSAPELERSSQ